MRTPRTLGLVTLPMRTFQAQLNHKAVVRRSCDSRIAAVKSRGCVLLVLIAVTLAPFARAQDLVPAADSLFREAVRLAEAGSYSEAITKFEASYSLDPARGTLLGLAMALERHGRAATALARYQELRELSTAAGDTARAEAARAGILRVQPNLAFIQVTLAGEHADVEVTLNDLQLPRGALDTKLPVDPGTHSVRARMSGTPVYGRSLIVHAGEIARIRIQLPVLTPPPPDTRTSLSTTTVQHDERVPETRPVAGYVVAGLGSVALAASAYFGLQTVSNWRDRNAHCPDGRCDAQAVEASDAARHNADLANLSFAIGVAGVGVGTYLILTSGTSPTQHDNVRRVAPVMVSAGGAW